MINERYGGKAGSPRIEYKSNDNATEAAGAWAREQVRRRRSQLRVGRSRRRRHRGCQFGPRRVYEVPILNRGETSCDGQPVGHRRPPHQATRGTIPGQPQRYYPSGRRNFFRVVPLDDHQGRAGASFMKRSSGSRGCTSWTTRGCTGRASPTPSGSAPKDRPQGRRS